MAKSPTYQKISLELLSGSHPRTRDIIIKRFGLDAGEPQTLEAIGQIHRITRERVRQIVDDELNALRKEVLQKKKRPSSAVKILNFFGEKLKELGHARREDLFVKDLRAEDQAPHIVFLLHLGDQFYRQRETEEFHPFWSVKPELVEHASSLHKAAISHFEKRNELLTDGEIEAILASQSVDGTVRVPSQAFFALLEASKELKKAYNGKWGLAKWPEVNPKGVREKAYIVLKNANEPLHFLEITKRIQELQEALSNGSKRILPQTVHNELIKDPRFVLVGRGTYALNEWGFEEGTVKEVLRKILQSSLKPLSKEEIIQKTLEQRQVRESTILLNLQNRSYFLRDPDGNYYLKIS